MFQVNNKGARTAPIVFVNFECIPQLALVFLLLILNMKLLTGCLIYCHWEKSSHLSLLSCTADVHFPHNLPEAE